MFNNEQNGCQNGIVMIIFQNDFSMYMLKHALHFIHIDYGNNCSIIYFSSINLLLFLHMEICYQKMRMKYNICGPFTQNHFNKQLHAVDN